MALHLQTLWNFILSAALGIQKLVVDFCLDGLLPGAGLLFDMTLLYPVQQLGTSAQTHGPSSDNRCNTITGEEVVTKESFISICWRLIPYWLNSWEQVCWLCVPWILADTPHARPTGMTTCHADHWVWPTAQHLCLPCWQEWGAECSSALFELPHFAVELLIVLPTVQIICSRLRILAQPQLRVVVCTSARLILLIPHVYAPFMSPGTGVCTS